MQKFKYPGLVTLAGFIFWLSACRHELPISGNTGGSADTTGSGTGSGSSSSSGGGCSADTVYFVQSVLPLLTSSCAQAGCHNGQTGGDAGDYTLNTYAGIRQIVQPGNAGSSRLISITSSGSMPPYGYTALSSDQIAMLSKWINQGAANNSCTASSCDTTGVTYSKTVVPILQTNCTGCHSGSAPAGGGVDLTTYANVSTQVASGKLWGDISHSTGYNAMPLGGSQLSACDRSKIHAWINAGAPNN